MDKLKRFTPLFLSLGLLAHALTGCGAGPSPTTTPRPPAPTAPQEQGVEAMLFQLTSSAFAPGEPIPQKHSCDGDDISPPLRWSDPPHSTQSLALIADDPDAPAGTWVHWVLYNLPAQTLTLPQAIPPDAELADGGQHGQNSWKRLGYGGPCPPSGTHRYFFKLYALDIVLDLDAGKNREQLMAAMEGHILAQAEVMGTYSRP